MYKRLIMVVVGMVILVGGWTAAGGLDNAAQELLLPYFEVEIVDTGTPGWNSKRSTYFSVGNASNAPVGVIIEVWSNWGILIPELTSSIELAPLAIDSVNLQDWLILGDLPDRSLDAAELAHVQAALAGAASPQDGNYYATEAGENIANGYIIIRSAETPGGRDVLWGDSMLVNPELSLAGGSALVQVGSNGPGGICRGHLARFASGGLSDSEFLIWTDLKGAPSASAVPPFTLQGSHWDVYDQDGSHSEAQRMDLLAAQAVNISDLGLTHTHGWVNLQTDGDAVVSVMQTADQIRTLSQSPCMGVWSDMWLPLVIR